jgi:hypothetical protein
MLNCLHIDLTFKLILHILNQQKKHRWLRCHCCPSIVVTNFLAINLHLGIKFQKQWWIEVHDLNSWKYIKKQPCYHQDPIINKPTRFLMEINKGSKRFKVNDKPNERIKLQTPNHSNGDHDASLFGNSQTKLGLFNVVKVVKFELHIDCFTMKFFIIDNLKSTTKPIDFISNMCNMS